MPGMTGINDPGYNGQKTKSCNAKIRDVACAADTAAATGRDHAAFL
jgi:hypothetical protein